MELMVLILLTAWFFVHRGAVDTATVVGRGVAWAADRMASGADHASRRSPWLGGLVGRWARGIAARLRNRPKPTAARTVDGQVLSNAVAGLAAVGMALLLVWVRLAVVDAIGAAHAAHQRRTQPLRWPRPGEPGAPVQATAQRTDRPPPPALPEGHSTSVTFTFTQNQQNQGSTS